MSDTLKLALRISAIDLFSGVLRRFRSEVAGTGAEAQALQNRYDQMINHTQAGLKSLAVGAYLYEKLKPAVDQAADLQESLLSVKGILQGAQPEAAKLADEMDRVRRNSIEVASHMKYSATAVTDVTRELIQGGVPLAAILERTDKSGRVTGHGAAYMTEVLAETKHMDPATVAVDIANLGHSFQLRPDQYGEAADIIAKASVTSSGTLEQLFHNLDQVGSRAHMYGNMDLRSTAIALKALAPLGEEAGSDLGEFLSRITGGSYRGRKWMAESGFNFYDKKGQFIGLDASIEQIQKRTEHMTQEQRNKTLGLLFGQTGGKAVTQLIAPSMPGVKSYWEIEKSYGQQAGLALQQANWETGFTASRQMLSSTNESTLASLFDPLLKPLTSLTQAMNHLSGQIGNAAENHPALAKTVSGAAVAGVAAAGGYGVYRLIKAAKVGSPLLKNFLRGTGSTAVGVAEGKAIEKLTGVTPVFVTNWPGSGVSGLPEAPSAASTVLKEGEEVGAAGGVGALLRRVLGRRLLSLGPSWAEVGAGGMGAGALITGAGVVGAGAGGYLLGHEINKHFIEPNANLSDKIGGTIASVLAMFGNKTAQQALDQHFNDLARAQTQQLGRIEKQPAKLEGTIRIQIDQDGRARVAQLKSNQPALRMNVGTMLSTP